MTDAEIRDPYNLMADVEPTVEQLAAYMRAASTGSRSAPPSVTSGP